MVFNNWITGHPRTVVSERREANKVIGQLKTWSVNAGNNAGRVHSTEPSGVPELGNKIQYLVRPMLLNFSGQSTENREPNRERTWKIFREFLLSAWCVYTCEENYQCQRVKCWKAAGEKPQRQIWFAFHSWVERPLSAEHWVESSVGNDLSSTAECEGHTALLP